MHKKQTRAERLKILFATHPKTDVFFLTSNDKAFFTEDDAKGFAQGLRDQTVTPCYCEELEANAKLKADIKAAAELEDKAKKEAEEKAAAELKANDKKPAVQKIVESLVKGLPEGTPTKEGWTIPQIKVWLKNNGVNFSANAKEDNLLGKVAVYLESMSAEGSGDAADGNSESATSEGAPKNEDRLPDEEGDNVNPENTKGDE